MLLNMFKWKATKTDNRDVNSWHNRKTLCKWEVRNVMQYCRHDEIWNIFNDLNAVSLTDRKDLSRELDILLQQGITPPALPPKGDTPAPDLPPKRSRVKSFKGSQFNNYAEAHSGRVRKFSNKWLLVSTDSFYQVTYQIFLPSTNFLSTVINQKQ